MKDPEFIDLRNRVLLGIGICLILFVPFYFFMHNKLLNNKSTILNKIDKEETFLVLVTNNKCKECKKYVNLLKNSTLSYNSINIDKDKNYEKIIEELDISSSDIIPPSIIYIYNGHLFATLTDIKNEEAVKSFIKNFNLEG